MTPDRLLCITEDMKFEPLSAITPIDGRYRAVSEPLSEYFSELRVIRARIRVECEYLLALSEEKELGIRKLTVEEKKLLQDIWRISIEDARIVKAIEKDGYEGIPATNHDVKAVEYFIKRTLAETSLVDISEFVHFAITSEDTDNIAYALLLGDVLDGELIPAIEDVRKNLADLAEKYGATPMLARTHGQPASATSFAKRCAYSNRVLRASEQLKTRGILVKFGGATGITMPTLCPHQMWIGRNLAKDSSRDLTF